MMIAAREGESAQRLRCARIYARLSPARRLSSAEVREARSAMRERASVPRAESVRSAHYRR